MNNLLTALVFLQATTILLLLGPPLWIFEFLVVAVAVVAVVAFVVFAQRIRARQAAAGPAVTGAVASVLALALLSYPPILEDLLILVALLVALFAGLSLLLRRPGATPAQEVA